TSYGNKTIGELLLSPTRTYLPFLNALPMDLVKSIKGIIHCTGGGQTKVLKFIKNKKVIKNNLLEIPPIFKIIQENSNTEWLEMYKVFNMGHRLEIYTNQSSATKIIEIANKFNIEAKVIGHVVEQPGESVLIQSPFGEFIYD
ncbi:MAG: hypothetical protein RJA52_555, partial [Bacteroidota bacterium]